MSKKLKLFGLLALTLALGAGVAWAALEPAPIALNGTYVADVLMTKKQAIGPSTANTFNTVTGKGSLTGSLMGDVMTGDGANPGAAATPLVLNLYAIAGDKVEIAPAATKFLGQTTAGGASVAAQPAGNLQVIVNGPIDLADNATNLSNGTILIRGANADRPTAAVRNRYYGGTFVYGGTLETSQNNALGQTWVALMARSAASRRPGATFAVNGTTKVQLGIEDPNSETTGQPVWLVRDPTEAGNVLQQAFINVDVVGNRKQELWLNHGVSEITGYTTASNAAAVNANARWVDVPLALTGQVPPTRAAAVDTSKMVQLVKTGAGLLYIGSDGTGLATGGGIDAYSAAINGARHEGGTIVRGGTLKIDGSNAPVWQSRYTGYLGSVWNLAGLAQANSYLQNSAGGAGAIHNPLYLEEDGKVIVDRSQIFSFFRGTAATGFEANAFTLAGVEERPSIFVTLNREHSNFAGTLSGNFDLVLDSKVSAWGFTAGNEVANDGQAVLTLSKADNTQQGTTLVRNGVLAVAGAHSIATAVPGTLTVGTGGAATPDKAVFRADANAVFTSPTIVNGPSGNTKFQTGGVIGGRRLPAPAILGEGALAALTGVTAEFTNVTINGSMQINPKAVTEVATAGSDESVNWMDTDSYVGWAGTVAFGVGENSSYDLGANPNNNVQVFVSNGIWHLGKLPDRANGSQANVVLRKGAALSLADGVRDFSPYFDVRFDDDARLHVVVHSSDIASSRKDAMEKAPIFMADDIDYTWLGRGESNKDKRIVLRLDISQLQNKLTAGSWIKVVGSNTAHGWNNLHHLRESSSTNKEDKVKVVVGFYGEGGRHITDIDLGDEDFSKLRPLDETGWSIMVPVMKSFDGGASDDVPPATPELTATLTPASGTTVKPGDDVVFEVKDWKFDGKPVEVENVKWMLNGEDKTVEAVGNKLTVKAGANGSKLELKVTANVKGDTAKTKTLTSTVTVSDGVTPSPSGPTKSSGGGGCDAGFSGLMLALAGLFLLKRKA